MFNRRDFIKLFPVCAAVCAATPNKLFSSDEQYIREAWHYESLSNDRVRCLLCPRMCVIRPGKRGVCGVRENQEGVLKTLVFGRLCSLNIDPIEKKPLYHFLPGEEALSVATAGCNVRCRFCQNWQISQAKPEDLDFHYLDETELVNLADKRQVNIIAHTYSEPVIFSEYVYECAKRGKEKGIRNVMISNGYINSKPLDDLCQYLDGIKIDLKAFTDEFYQKLVSGRLQPVLDTLVRIRENDVWLEVVYLVIPGQNDSSKETQNMCRWFSENLGNDVPLHFTRFYPHYQMKNVPPTPLPTLKRAASIAKGEGLKYVYVGNVPGQEGANTVCPSCGKTLILRTGYRVRENHIKNGKCRFCQETIPGVWT